MNYYASIGWKISGKAPMKDWKAAVRTWVINDRKRRGSYDDDSQPAPSFVSHREHDYVDGDERKAMYQQMGAKV